MTTGAAVHRRNRLSVDVLAVLGNRLVIFAIALVLASARGHFLGVEAFGVFSVGILLPALLATALNLGISISSVYFVGRGEVGIRQALRSGLLLAAIMSAAGLALCGLILAQWGHAIFPDVPPTILWIALASFPLLLVRTILAGLLQAVEDFRSYNRLLVFEFVSTLVLTLLAFQFWQATPAAAVLAVAAGMLLTVLASLRAVSRHAANDHHPHVPNYTRDSLHYGWKANVSNVLAYLNYRLDVVLVNFFVGTAGAGIYTATLVLSERLWALSQAVSTVTFPRLASLHASPDKANQITEQTSRCVLVITLLISVAIAAVAYPLLTLIYGASFGVGASTLIILLPGCVIASATRVLTNSLAAAGYVGWNAIAAGLLLTVDVVANLVLLPRMGIRGAAIASTLGWTVHAILIISLYAKFQRRRWWLPLVPQRSDWESLVALATHGYRKATLVVANATANVQRFRVTRRQFAVRATVCVVVGCIVTSYFEDRQIAFVAPLRNLIVLGSLHNRGDSTFSPTHYQHASGMNPVHVAMTVRPQTLRVLESFERGQTITRAANHDQLLSVADYFVSSGRKFSAAGAPCHLWQYEFDYPYYGIQQPWRSAMAQGHAIEVLLAAYLLTNRAEYLTTAEAGANGMVLPIDPGGTAIVEGSGLWFEEYASDSGPPPHVLNGHNFALEGLWHLAQFDASYQPLFNRGVTALKQRLAQFDHRVWSSYDLAGTLASRKYHKIHCDQLHTLFHRTHDPFFDGYADRLEAQLHWPFAVFYRLVVAPTRALVALTLLNSLVALLVWTLVEHSLRLAASSRTLRRELATQNTYPAVAA
jgi:O-antigen/teichoic acid export membrane protein